MLIAKLNLRNTINAIALIETMKGSINSHCNVLTNGNMVFSVLMSPRPNQIEFLQGSRFGTFITAEWDQDLYDFWLPTIMCFDSENDYAEYKATLPDYIQDIEYTSPYCISLKS